MDFQCKDSASAPTSVVGTPLYMSPELHKIAASAANQHEMLAECNRQVIYPQPLAEMQQTHVSTTQGLRNLSGWLNLTQTTFFSPRRVSSMNEYSSAVFSEYTQKYVNSL